MTANAPMPEATGQVADAVRGNWVDHYAPAPTRPYLRLSRADRPIGTWLLLLPCWWGLTLAIVADGRHSWSDLWIAVGCALGAFLMRGAGCTWNDITDRDIDAQVARTRSRPILWNCGRLLPLNQLFAMGIFTRVVRPMIKGKCTCTLRRLKRCGLFMEPCR